MRLGPKSSCQLSNFISKHLAVMDAPEPRYLRGGRRRSIRPIIPHYGRILGRHKMAIFSLSVSSFEMFIAAVTSSLNILGTSVNRFLAAASIDS